MRDQSAPRTFETYVVLSELPIDLDAALAELDPYSKIINDEALRNGGTVRISIAADGSVSTNAQLDWDGTQYIDSTKMGGLEVKIEVNDGQRVAGRVWHAEPIVQDGQSRRLDVRFDTAVRSAPRGRPMAADGGPAGKAYMAYAAAVAAGDFAKAQALMSASMAQRYAKEDYETEEENAKESIDMLQMFLLKKSRVTGGEAFDDHVILEVEGEMFGTTRGLELVRMVKVGDQWRYDDNARAGMLAN
jgi:hypothetical protein